MNTYIATFFSHYGAIVFSKKLKKQGCKATLMPVPRKLSASCGTCVKFQRQDVNFEEEHEDLENFYIVENDEYEKTD